MGRKVVKGGQFRPTIAVSREAKDSLADWLAQNDHPEQGAIVGRIIGWFVTQPPLVQDVVLGRVREEMRAASANALRMMADRLEPEGELDDISPVILPERPEKVMHPKKRKTG